MYKTLSGKEIAEEVLAETKERIGKLANRNPKLVIVQVGEDPASAIYVRSKMKKADAVGINAEVKKLPEKTKEKELLSLVNSLNSDDSVDGFIVQLPLPKTINADKIINSINPSKDVDGFTSANIGKLFLGLDAKLLPATPSGIIRMIEHYKIPVEGKHVVIIGRSNIVGKPIASMLLNRNATVTICHSKTLDLAKHTTTADLLIVAIGKPGFIKADMVKEGAYVIDVGTTKIGEKLVGDVDFENVIKKAHCSPVPGGVGPLTGAMLIHNVQIAAENR